MESHIRGIDGDFTGVPAHFAFLALLIVVSLAVGLVVHVAAGRRGER